MVSSCATCGTSWELPVLECLHVVIHIPEECYGSQVSNLKFKDLIETSFDHPAYNQERSGCDEHPNSGALETEVLVNTPDFLLVVINRVITVNDEDGLRYVTRKEYCGLPEHVTLPTRHGRQFYELFCAIEWDGVASPTSGRTHGHYTAFVKFGDQWVHMNDNLVKKLSSKTLSKKAYVCGFTRYDISD